MKHYPVVDYTHYLLSRPVRIFRYKRLRFSSERLAVIAAKLLAVLHDYILCTEKDYGIRYGVGHVE